LLISRKASQDLLVVLDKNTNQILRFDIENRAKNIPLETEFLKHHSSIDIRRDLIDCEIDICSPEVILDQRFKKKKKKKKEKKKKP